MTWNALLPVLLVCSSLVPGVFIFFVPEQNRILRTTLNLTGATLSVVLVGAMLWGVAQEQTYETRIDVLEDLSVHLHADALSLLFASLSGLLWLITTVYAIGYLEASPNRSRFFGFFSLCISATTGIALAGNLVTLLVFYELLTLATYPLVIHRGTVAAMKAGRVYLFYTVPGGAVLLLAIMWLHIDFGPIEFTEGGFLRAAAPELYGSLRIVFVLLIAGFGVKAALVPLHGWLPVAMIAPAPVSALLHAVAVVKAGAFGVVRVVYDVYGVELCSALGVLPPLVIMASITIIYGSLRAMVQDDLKRRLAYSTVSQVSYIALGAAILGPVATIGGIVHLVHQGIMKITLFFCAGNLAETLGVHRISEMNGVGRRMPWTMTAFTVAALGMIGIPPTAGFISKWYLAAGSAEEHRPWIIVVLLISTALNAAYFLPIVYRAWFKPADAAWREHRPHLRTETSLALLLPCLCTALLVLLVGMFANAPISPLTWARLIVMREYEP